MNVFKSLYRKIVPKRIRQCIYNESLFFRDKERYYRIKKNRKRNVKFGPKNKDKHFFVCRRDNYATGLLSCYVHVLGQLIEIDKDIQCGKLIPVMDMFTEHFDLIHNVDDGIKKINAWDYYFKPFSDYSMKDVLESKHVTLSYGFLVKEARPFVKDYDFNRDIVERTLPVHNRYFHLKDDLKLKFEEDAKKIFAGKRVLGTNIREGYIVLANGKKNNEKYYKGLTIDGHPIQQDIYELCNELEAKMKEWKCDYLYAEFQTTYIKNILESRFGDRFIHSDRKLKEVSDLSLKSWVEESKNNPITNRVQNNIEYLESIYFLSKCTSLYSSKCSGTVVAALWNNNEYENMEIINRGVY